MLGFTLTDHSSLITYHIFERAVSSVVEHLVYTEGVGGSKPSPPIFDFSFFFDNSCRGAGAVLPWNPKLQANERAPVVSQSIDKLASHFVSRSFDSRPRGDAAR